MVIYTSKKLSSSGGPVKKRNVNDLKKRLQAKSIFICTKRSDSFKNCNFIHSFLLCGLKLITLFPFIVKIQINCGRENGFCSIFFSPLKKLRHKTFWKLKYSEIAIFKEFVFPKFFLGAVETKTTVMIILGRSAHWIELLWKLYLMVMDSYLENRREIFTWFGEVVSVLSCTQSLRKKNNCTPLDL